MLAKNLPLALMEKNIHTYLLGNLKKLNFWNNNTSIVQCVPHTPAIMAMSIPHTYLHTTRPDRKNATFSCSFFSDLLFKRPSAIKQQDFNQTYNQDVHSKEFKV